METLAAESSSTIEVTVVSSAEFPFDLRFLAIMITNGGEETLSFGEGTEGTTSLAIMSDAGIGVLPLSAATIEAHHFILGQYWTKMPGKIVSVSLQNVYVKKGASMEATSSEASFPADKVVYDKISLIGIYGLAGFFAFHLLFIFFAKLARHQSLLRGYGAFFAVMTGLLILPLVGFYVLVILKLGIPAASPANSGGSSFAALLVQAGTSGDFLAYAKLLAGAWTLTPAQLAFYKIFAISDLALFILSIINANVGKAIDRHRQEKKSAAASASPRATPSKPRDDI